MPNQITTRRAHKFLIETVPLAKATRCPQGKETALKELGRALFFTFSFSHMPRSGKFSLQSPPKFPGDLLSVTKRDSPGVQAALYPRTLHQRERL